MKKGRPPSPVARALAALCVFGIAAAGAGCARTVTEPAPVDNVLEVRAEFKADLDPDLYYYFAFETETHLRPDSTGPRPQISGDDRGKNWDYFVLWHDRAFKELKVIDPNMTIDSDPTFLTYSKRYIPTPTASGASIRFKVLLSDLVPVSASNRTVRMNIVVAQSEITVEREVEPLDYLRDPFVEFLNRDGERKSESQELIAGHEPPQGFEAADIVDWSIQVIQ